MLRLVLIESNELLVYFPPMIEIRKNPNAEDRKREYLLFIDGVLMENAYVNHRTSGPYEVGAKDSETSEKIAAHNLTEFPPSLACLYLHYYPNDIEHLDNKLGTFITQDFNDKQKTNECFVHLNLGDSSLTQWRSPYSFSEYAFELYQILKENRDVLEVNLGGTHDAYLNKKTEIKEDEFYYTPIELEKIDKNSISILELVFPYSSPEVRIADDLSRISKLLREAHNKALTLILPHHNKTLLEFRKVEGKQPKEYQLFVNGSVLEASEAYKYENDSGTRWGVSIENQQALKELGDTTFLDIPERTSFITVELDSNMFSRWELITTAEQVRIHTPFEPVRFHEAGRPVPFAGEYNITFFANLNIHNWRGPHSPQEYADEIIKMFADTPEVAVYFHDFEQYYFNLIVLIDTPQFSLSNEVYRAINYVRRFLDEIENKLGSTVTHNSIVKSFNFPEEVGVSCEQYLLYFVQFLRDLGVDATSELKHKAGQVLFTITPTSEEEALDKIRTALEVYLRLPTSPVSNDMSNEIAVQRMESQILRFQSDLKLAGAELQAKNATIEAQQLTINVQKGLLSGDILLNSMKDATPKEKEDDREEFFDGSVALTIYKDKGVEFNLAKIFRQLRNLFIEDDK